MRIPQTSIDLQSLFLEGELDRPQVYEIQIAMAAIIWLIWTVQVFSGPDETQIAMAEIGWIAASKSYSKLHPRWIWALENI